MMDYGIPFRQHGLKYFQEVWQMDTTNTSKKLARAAYSALGEALAVAGLFNMTNALADGFQIEPDVLPPLDV